MPIRVGPDGRATYTGTITGNGSAITFTVTHNLGITAGKYDVQVTDSNGKFVFVDWIPTVANTTTQMTFIFAIGMAPGNDVVYNVTITGIL
jgi:hypothetical protein